MSDIFCSAPWTSIFIDTNGSVTPCCASSMPWGNIRQQPLNEIINGKIHLEVKESLMNGQPHQHCRRCYELEKTCANSTRFWFNEFVPVQTPVLEDYKLQMIDIRWSNHCNLRCLYCNSNSSSSIAEFKKIKQKQSIRQWQQEILALIKENILTIREVYLLGGEPLLIKENLELLEYINDQHITLITNLSLDNSKNQIYKKLVSKPNVNWEISLEQVGKKFEYVRNNASWNQVIDNVIELKNLGKNISFNVLYCIYSSLDFYRVLHELKNYSAVMLNFIIEPDYLDVRHHCMDIKQIAISEIDKTLADADLLSWLGESNISNLTNFRQNLLENHEKDLSNKFLFYEKNNPGPLTFQELWPREWQLIQNNVQLNKK